MSSEPTNFETVVDDLSKPGNEAVLEKTLNDAFNNTADDAPADATGQNKDVKDNPAPATEPVPTDPNAGGDHSQPGNEPDNGPKNGDRFADLLKDRNEARSAAANAQGNEQVLAKQVKDLTDLVAKLQNGEGVTDNNQPADDKPVTADVVKSLVKEILQEQNKSVEEQQAAEKSDTEEVSKLLSHEEFGEAAKPYEPKIREVMKAHPTVSAVAAYAMAVGVEALNGGNAAPASNTNKTTIGNRSKTTLRREAKPTDMANGDMEAYLRTEAAAGRLDV